jgi:hypothetical protein
MRFALQIDRSGPQGVQEASAVITGERVRIDSRRMVAEYMKTLPRTKEERQAAMLSNQFVLLRRGSGNSSGGVTLCKAADVID